MADPSKWKDFHELDFSFGGNQVLRSPLPLPLSSRLDKPALTTSSTDDRRGCGVDDKLAALCVYRFAHGLCV